MTRMRRMRLVGPLGAASLALAGCGVLDSGSDSEGAAAPPPPTSSSASAAAAEGGARAPAGNARVTPPGTRLRIGQRAVVPYRTGTIGITVTAIERGDQAAFQQKFGSRAAGMTPYYIRYTVQNVGGTDLSHSAAPLLQGVGPDGGSTGAVVVGGMPGCDRTLPDRSFASAGATYRTCRLQAASAGRTVAGAKYEDGEYRSAPVVWMG